MALGGWFGNAGAANPDIWENDTVAGVYFFMDRPVYKPGDSVRFKGVLWGREGGTGIPFPIAGKTMLITPEQPPAGNDDPVVLYAVTDSVGGFAGEFRLSARAATGFWKMWMRPLRPSRAERRRAEAADTSGQKPGLLFFNLNPVPYVRVATRLTPPSRRLPLPLYVTELQRLSAEANRLKRAAAKTAGPVWQQTHIPFAIQPGEQIVLTLPKSLGPALRKSKKNDTAFYWMPEPSQRVTRFCEEIALDTTAEAWNALLHYLKAYLLDGKSEQTATAYNRLHRFLTDEDGFCRFKGQPADSTVSLAIAEALAANIQKQQNILRLLQRTLLPYLERTAYGRRDADTAAVPPTAARLRYLYTAALVYGPDADRYTAALNRDLHTFAENIDRYPVCAGIYGIYALYLHGDTALLEPCLQHYRRAALHGQKMDLPTAALVYRLLMSRDDRADAVAVSRWIGRQDRTRAIDGLTLAYNERLFPLPVCPETTPATWELRGRKLTIDWRAAATDTTGTPDTVCPAVYGTLTFGYRK
ncbi:MAG: hypothetical protein K2K51_00965 [Bacteroidales bacterium]|nr:hypothetical protein [Bacteroidales bacterium]